MVAFNKNKGGFTLIEVSLVIGVLLLLGVGGFVVKKQLHDQKTQVVLNAPANSVAASSIVTVTDSCTLKQPKSGVKLVIGSDYLCTTYIKLNNIFVLDGTSGSYGTPSTATSDNTEILSPTTNPSNSACGGNDSCSAFRAVGSGSVTLTWSGPSGCHHGVCISAKTGRMKVVII